MMHFQLMHESLSRFSESFASFLYGLNMNAFCVDYPEVQTMNSQPRRQAFTACLYADILWNRARYQSLSGERNKGSKKALLTSPITSPQAILKERPRLCEQLQKHSFANRKSCARLMLPYQDHRYVFRRASLHHETSFLQISDAGSQVKAFTDARAVYSRWHTNQRSPRWHSWDAR